MATFTTPSGVTIGYDDQGNGPPLVLVHGITESRRTWDPLVPALAADRRVVAVDLRGHGSSTRQGPYDLATFAADVHDVLEALGIGGEAVLVGHSLGGTVVTAYAAAYPCRGVVNVDQPLDLGAFQASLQQLAPLLRGDEAEFNQALAMVFDAMRGPLSDAEAARIEAIRRPEQEVVMGVWSLVIDSPADQLDAVVRALASAVTVPYLSLHGLDPGDEYAGWLAERIPTATVERWPEHGHYPHLVEPERFVGRVTAFADGVTGPA